MKVALINMGNNVTDYKTTPSAETLHLANSLRGLGLEVDVISNKDTDNTIAYDSAGDPNEYERLIVINGSVNFFGGAENYGVLNAQKFMAAYKSKIYYLLTDIRLGFTQSWNAIQGKPWKDNYSEETLHIKSPIRIISQGSNLDIAKDIHKKVTDVELEYSHFPLERYKIYEDGFKIAKPTDKKCDVIYGGSFRAGQREGKMVEFLFDTGLDVEFFGTAKESQFKNVKKFPWTNPPRFGKKVPNSDMVNKLSEGVVTVIIGDKSYNDNFTTLRVWEAMASDSIMIIDSEFDTKRRIIDDERFYVKNKAELIEIVNKLKSDNDLRVAMLSIQRNELYKQINRKCKWQNDLKEVLEIE